MFDHTKNLFLTGQDAGVFAVSNDAQTSFECRYIGSAKPEFVANFLLFLESVKRFFEWRRAGHG